MDIRICVSRKYSVAQYETMDVTAEAVMAITPSEHDVHESQMSLLEQCMKTIDEAESTVVMQAKMKAKEGWKNAKF